MVVMRRRRRLSVDMKGRRGYVVSEASEASETSDATARDDVSSMIRSRVVLLRHAGHLGREIGSQVLVMISHVNPI